MISEVKRILIVDDEEDYCLMTKMWIEAYGYQVDYAFDPEAGLKKVASFNPHLVLLDVIMPGMTGWEMCQRIKSDPKTKDIPVFLSTATQIEFELHQKAKEVGAAGVFLKPLDEAAFFKTIKLLLG